MKPFDFLTQRLLEQAVPFRRFDAALSVVPDPAASRLLKKKYWRVTQAFKYYTGAPEDQRWVYIPAGYLTDGASVPRPLWWLLRPWGRYGQAAVVHDWLCEYSQLYHRGQLVPITRAQADGIFREAMKVAGVGVITRQVMYLGVRAFARLKVWLNWSRADHYRAKQALEQQRLVQETA